MGAGASASASLPPFPDEEAALAAGTSQADIDTWVAGNAAVYGHGYPAGFPDANAASTSSLSSMPDALERSPAGAGEHKNDAGDARANDMVSVRVETMVRIPRVRTSPLS